MLLAFAEGRPSGCADNAHVRVVVRSSADRGRSWGPIVAAAASPGMKCGNPSPVVDASTGRVFLHYVREPRDLAPDARARVTYSDSAGQSWSPPVDVTSIARAPGTNSYGPGVGGGIQLTDANGHPGRLLVLAEEDSKRGTPNVTYGAVPLYSDDHGSSWLRGDQIMSVNNRSHGPGEPGVALLGNSSTFLVMAARGAQTPVVGFASSTNGGVSWSRVRSIPEIHNGGGQSSIEGAKMPDGSWGVVISSPVNPPGAHRSNLTIFTSSAMSGFEKWSSAGMLWDGHAGYNSLLAVPGTNRSSFFCLFESGNKSELEVLRLLQFELV